MADKKDFPSAARTPVSTERVAHQHSFTAGRLVLGGTVHTRRRPKMTLRPPAPSVAFGIDMNVATGSSTYFSGTTAALGQDFLMQAGTTKAGV